MKKALRIIGTTIVGLVLVAAMVWQGEMRTIASIHKVTGNDPYLYEADYKASYDLDKVVEAGLDENSKLISFVIGQLSRGLYKPDLSGKQVGNGFACTSFQARNADGDGYHYLVADAAGNCAAIEFDLFDGWKTMILRKAEGEPAMLITNHLITPKYYTTEPDPVLGNPHSRSWWRYDVAKRFLDERNGSLTLDEAQQCLSDVHWKDLTWEDGTVEDTQWSGVYDQSTLKLRLRDWYDYSVTHEFTLR